MVAPFPPHPGPPPFDTKELLASGLDEMRRTIREKEPVRPSTRLTQRQTAQQASATSQSQIKNQKSKIEKIEPDLDWIVMKCLEKDRTRRYETANGLATDLLRHLNHEPVVARPPSAAYRLQKLVRRNRLAVTAASVVALSLVLGLGLAITGWMQAQAERDKAIKAHAREAAARIEADANAREARENARRARESEQAARQSLRTPDPPHIPSAVMEIS